MIDLPAIPAYEPQYEAEAFVYDGDVSIYEYGLTEEQIMGMAYLKSIRSRVVYGNKTWLCAADGPHRAGKSLSVCTASLIMDSSFEKNMFNRFIFEPRQLYDEMEKIRRNGVKGAVIAVDEAGASLSAMDWYEQWAKAVSEMFMIIGYLNPIVFFIAPVRDFVNSPIRKMQHAYWKFNRPNTNRGYTFLKPYELSYSSTYKKTFNKRPTVKFNGVSKIIDKIRFGLPPTDIIRQYEEIETPRKDKLLVKFGEEIKQSETRAVKIEQNPQKIIDHIADQYHMYENRQSKPDKVALDPDIIRYRFNVPNNLAKYIRTEAERKIVEKKRAVAELAETGKDAIAKKA